MDTAGTSNDPESLESVCSLLANGRRRALLGAFIEHEGEAIDFSKLVDELARRENASRRSVAIELHHVHLPKAVEAGVVEYDPEGETVRYGGHDVVETVLEASERSVRSCTEA